ncbi:MAG: fumarylacetoacetate hydrolase family protein [Pseudomonadota bacterium]
MKLLRYGPPGAEKPGLIDEDGVVRDLSAHIDDISGETLSDASLDKLRALDHAGLPTVADPVRIGPSVGNVGKLVCIGLNYSDHAAESGMDVPTEPVVFMKATSSICGPYDTVEIPRGSLSTDWEVELAIVIGTAAKYIDEADAMNHVAGFTIVNDVSERDFQLRRLGQWVKGKSHDTFAPMGPWMVTRDEIADIQNLEMFLDVSGTRMQSGTTQTMIFSVAHCVAYVSQFMSLQPGDVISTGTPPGVGMGKKPDPIYLKPGDVMELGIEGLGTQRQDTVAA